MKNSRLFVIFVSLAACAFFFTSCTLEKRHYRSGYYVQHSSGAYNRDDSRKKSANAEENIAGFRANENAEHPDNVCVQLKIVQSENKIEDSCGNIHAAEERDKHDDVAYGNSDHQPRQPTTSARQFAHDDPNELKPDNTGPLWISALIFMGIFILFIILAAAIWETLIIGSLLALPIALILVIVASVRDRRNRKANPEANDKENGKKGVGILKKILKWTLIVLATLTLAAIIGLIVEYS